MPGASVLAATCPFDTGGSDAMNDGVVLTRYALGITGAPLVTSTRYASLDPLQVKNNIECIGCALDINGDGQIDTVDTTIIARHLVGFKDASLTDGLALGSGSRNTTAAVTSFLANGCAVGGALNAFTLGGNAFGNTSISAYLGTTDGKPLIVGTGVGSGLRMFPFEDADNPGALAISNGSSGNSAGAPAATVAGGGHTGYNCYDAASYTFTRTCGNLANAPASTVSGGASNVASGTYGTVAGGIGNTAGPYASIAGGISNIATGSGSAIAGGTTNRATGNFSFVASGYMNAASGESSFVSGLDNYAAGANSFVAGGYNNVASADSSFASGANAKAQHANSFVWGGSNASITASSAAGQFRVYAPESIRMFASTTPGAGCFLYTPANGWQCSSDRDLKTNIRLLNTLDILKRVIAMPLSSWSFKGAEAYTHIGPMAQDFSKAFALGADDKTISAMDSSGVALAAIQGLHKLIKDKDAKITALERANAAMQRDVAMLKRRLGM